MVHITYTLGEVQVLFASQSFNPPWIPT